jgi:hypothetical protein
VDIAGREIRRCNDDGFAIDDNELVVH